MIPVYDEFKEGATQLQMATESSTFAHRLALLRERREEQGKPILESLGSDPFFQQLLCGLSFNDAFNATGLALHRLSPTRAHPLMPVAYHR